jgi:hypothetical protein
MNPRRLKHLFTAIPVLASAMLLTALTNPAAAQSEACVHLQVGSGYAATMTVTFQNATIGPSGSFAIGQTVCLPLTAVGNGVPFSVQVHAIAGDTVTCVPSDIPRSAALPIGITYNASGTTLNVHCDAPTGATLEEEPKPKP